MESEGVGEDSTKVCHVTCAAFLLWQVVNGESQIQTPSLATATRSSLRGPELRSVFGGQSRKCALYEYATFHQYTEVSRRRVFKIGMRPSVDEMSHGHQYTSRAFHRGPNQVANKLVASTPSQ